MGQPFGGGIHNMGALTIADSTVDGNTAEGSESIGGGIFSTDQGSTSA